MSSQLPIINLSSAVVGSQYTLDFTAFVKFNPANIPQNARLALYNESGCGLSAQLNQSGQTFFIPAGGWGVANIHPNDSTCVLTVTYLLPSAPITQLIAVYYAPTEQTPPIYSLGNSPIGGAVQATTPGVGVATSLSNIGNAPSATAIIEIKEQSASGDQFFTDNQGNFLIQDYVSSVLTTMFRTIAGVAANGVNILIGDANRQVQINGVVQAQARIFANGAITALDPAGSGLPSILSQIFHNNNFGFQGYPNSGVSGYTDFQAENSGSNATAGMGFNANGTNIGLQCNANATGIKFNGPIVNYGIDFNSMTSGTGIRFINGGANNSLSRWQVFTGLTVAAGASQTISHNLGVVPTLLLICMAGTTNGNFSLSIDTNSGSSTQFRVATSSASSVSPVNALLAA